MSIFRALLLGGLALIATLSGDSTPAAVFLVGSFIALSIGELADAIRCNR